MKTKAIIILSILFIGFVFSSCEKESTQSIVDNDKVISIVDAIDLFDTDDAEEATSDNTKSALETVRCFELIHHPNENGEFWPKSWTLDFGEEGCESPNGTLRSGKIHVSLTDIWRNEGSLRTITYEDFYSNKKHIEGTKTIENKGLNENQNPTWEWNIIDGVITDSVGNITTWSATRYSKMVEGADTWGFFDNIYEVTGGGSGIKDSQSFTVEITTPLRYKFRCRFPVSGVLQIKIEGAETIIIDYGEGECDKIATKQVGDTIEEITLCKR